MKFCYSMSLELTCSYAWFVYFGGLFRVLCKYFSHGACLKGEYCEFSHDWSAPPSNVNITSTPLCCHMLRYKPTVGLALRSFSLF